ncbi:MAG: hypothetical protein AAGD06_18760 [Acidobacteriota bacterium]
MSLRFCALAAFVFLLTAGCASQAPEPAATPSKPSGRELVARQVAPAAERGFAYPVHRRLDELTSAVVVPGPRPQKEGRIESSLREDEIIALQEQASRLPADSAFQPLGAGGVDFSLGTNFDSIDVTECCGSGDLNPPDPELAVGPGHVVAAVNASVEIYTLDGTSVFGPTPLETFYSGLPGGCTAFPFDPNAIYDELGGRFIVGADGNGTSYCVAVSDTSNPLDGWTFYDFAVNVNGEFFDYPHIGVGHDAVYVGSNMFGVGSGRVFAFDKTAMYAGQMAQSVSQAIGANTTPQPLKLHGAADGSFPTSGPHYILTSRGGFGNPDTFGLFSWDDPFGTNTLTDLGTLDIQAAHGVTLGFPVESPQQGGGSIAGNDPRGLDFEYRNGSSWMTMHASCNPGSGTVNCIQWAEIDTATVSVVQAGVFATDDEFRIFPDLAVNACGDALIGYTKTSATSLPGVYVAGRKAADSQGSMQGEIEIKAGESVANEPDRWGDYTSMTVSPDGKTLWYLGEYGKTLGAGRNWGTYIGSVTFADCEGSTTIFQDNFESGNTSAWSLEL